jgi:N-methylhydantoinase A
VVNENMALAGKIHIAERGGDPLKTTLVAMGGVGPVHAYGLAKKLRMPEIIIPMRAGVASSLGFFCAPFSYEIVKTFRMSLENSVPADIGDAFNKMKKEAATYLPKRESKARISYDLFLDMHYVGQGFDISITLPDLDRNTVDKDYIADAFGEKYEEIYGRRCPDKIEIMNLRVVATIKDRAFSLKTFPSVDDAAPEQAMKGTRRAYSSLEADYIDYLVYDRYRLSPGAEIIGPAIVEERESTTVLGEDAHAYVDERKSIIINMKANVDNE